MCNDIWVTKMLDCHATNLPSKMFVEGKKDKSNGLYKLVFDST
jgi:hypothetical protein